MSDYRASPPAAAVRVFIVDDHEVIARGIGGLLDATTDLELVGTATTAADALRSLPATRPDVVLLDVNLPDGSGIEVCRELRSRLPALGCLILTSHDEDEARLATLLAGAAGWLSKQSTTEAILGGIRQVAHRSRPSGPARTGPVRSDAPAAANPEATAPGDVLAGLISAAAVDGLAPDQQHLVGLVAEGLTNQQIAAQLGVPEIAVAQRITLLFTTLGLRRRIDAGYRRANEIL